MQIRPMELEDIEQVAMLGNQTWDTFNMSAPLPIANKSKIIKDFENGTHYLVAEENQGILGVLDYRTYYPFPSGHHVITFDITVSEKTRGQGIGHKLIQTFFDMAKANGHQKALIHVLSSNGKTCAFHEKLGFKREVILKNQFYLNHTCVDDLVYSYYLEEIHTKQSRLANTP